jgi:hypothetical protein
MERNRRQALANEFRGVEKDSREWISQLKSEPEAHVGVAILQLFVRDLITEDIIVTSVQDVITEMITTSKQSKHEQTEENTTQYVDFLFESSKVLPSSAVELKKTIKTALVEFLAIPRPDLPNLCMRSRFRLEDTLKCVQ